MNALVAAYRKRSKAIKHKVKCWEIGGGVEAGLERLDLDFDTWGDQVRLSAWEDGMLWWRVCRGGKTGRAVNYAFDARAEVSDTREVRLAFEDSLLCLERQDEV